MGGADFGRNPGSVVDVVIKSGANAIHASAYYFNRNEAFAAVSPFSPPGANPMLRNYNVGGSIGGAIKKDKLFLFLGFEKQKLITPNNILATVPTQSWVNDVQSKMAAYEVPLNPPMLAFLHAAWPWSTIQGLPATTDNYVSNDNNIEGSNNFVGRIDYNINNKNRFFVRSIIGTGDVTAYAGAVFGEYFQAVPSRQENWAAVWTSTLTNRLVNQMLFGYNYFLQEFDDANHGLDVNALGFHTGAVITGTPNITITGFNYGGVGETPNLGRTDQTWHITDDLVYTLGAHTFKFGGEFRDQTLFVHYYRNARGAFSFDGTAGPWANDPSFSGTEAAFADFMGGYIKSGYGSFATGDPARTWHTLSGTLYFADTWQVKPTLSLNYGVHYDYNGPYYDPTHGASTWSPGFPTSLSPPSLAFPGTSGSPISSLYPPDKTNFGPRVGFAWTPRRGGKTVIRGGWGVYYNQPGAALFVDSNAGDSTNRGASRNPGGPNPVFNVNNPALVIVQNNVPIFGSSPVPAPPWGLWAVDQGFRSPYTQNYSLNVQQQLTPHTILQVGYVGSQARKQLVNINANQPPPSPTAYANVQAARPYNSAYPMYSGITYLMTAGNAHYNSLQVSLRNTAWRGLTGQLSYTLSRARDDMSGDRNSYPTDSHNLRGDWGLADFDTPQALSGYLVYDLPQLGHSMPRLTTGCPFSVSSGVDNSHTLQGKDRADQAGNPFSGVTSAGVISQHGVQFFNPTAFTYNAPGTFGNTKRNAFRGLAYHDVDLALIKNTKITEKISGQLRFELFNIFNILNLGCLDAGVPDGTFGRAGCTLSTGNGSPGIGPGEPFNMQIALKLRW
jgi:hypothetical protein